VLRGRLPRARGYTRDRMRTLGRAVVGLTLLLCLSGCATYIGRAKRAYVQGRYLEVSEDLGRHEEDVPYLSPVAQIDYGLYRGLALTSLGDASAARRWLTFAKQVEKENPGSMLPEQHALLSRALADLAALREAPPPSPPAPPPPAPPPVAPAPVD
jgi:hypothetical protein